MDYSYQNTDLWNGVIQIGIIAITILIATLLRRKLPFVRKSLMPTAVLAGFLLLIVRNTGLLNIDAALLETLTYHGIAIGFIAMSLRLPRGKTMDEKGSMTAAKSGALIASSYVVQGIVGLLITLGLAYTFMPDMFKAAGILLPMGYGQGPGQANNIGSTYEALGFTGGRSFGLAIASAGFLCACIVGVIYLNILRKKGRITKKQFDEVSGSVTTDSFQDAGEIPIAESIDRFSMQVALVIAVYLAAYLLSRGIMALIERFAPGLYGTVSPLLWGFNFLIGSALAILTRVILKALRKGKVMTRQYQNNYLLSRISGVAFDFMIVGGIASINIEDLSGLWIPFVLLAVAGGLVTLFYLKRMSKILYPQYADEGFISMYGMMTGTISSGVLLLREIDPEFETPASNNLITGTSFAIVFAAPILLLISLAPKSDLTVWIVLGILVVYLALLLLFMVKAHRKVRAPKAESKESD